MITTLHGHASADVGCVPIGRLYYSLHIKKHKERLEALPQAAALFLSECRVLSLVLQRKRESLERSAAVFLQCHIKTLLSEMEDLEVLGGAMQLDSVGSVEHIIKRPIGQIILQLERFKSNTRFMLEGGDEWLRDVQQRTCIVLMRRLSEACWTIIYAASGGISKDCLAEVKQTILLVLSFYDIDDVTVSKLRSLTVLLDQPLLQWIGAFRKGLYKKTFTSVEFHGLVKIIFAESAMRSSFLKEIISCSNDTSSSSSSCDEQ
jgi:hypothetical protein